MNWLSRLLGKHQPSPSNPPEEQAILIRLDGSSQPESYYDEDDVSSLEDRLREALSSLGEVDGNEVGMGEATIYMYGPDAEAMFGVIEPVLRAHPPAGPATVTIRKGAPGAPEREVSMPARGA